MSPGIEGPPVGLRRAQTETPAAFPANRTLPIHARPVAPDEHPWISNIAGAKLFDENAVRSATQCLYALAPSGAPGL